MMMLPMGIMGSRDDSMDMNKALLTPIGLALAMLLLLVTGPFLISLINGWYLWTVDAGMQDGTRFDRVLTRPFDTELTADEAWAASAITEGAPLAASATALAADTYYLLENNGGKCSISGSTNITAALASAEMYTPSGSVVSVSAGAEEPALIAGCKWDVAAPFLSAGGIGALPKLLLEAAGIAPVVAILGILGGFGSYFRSRFGGGPIFSVVIIVIAVVIAGMLMGLAIPFISNVYAALSPARFLLYSSGLGAIVPVLKSFFGVVFVGGLMVFVWQTMRGFKNRGNVLDEGSM